MSLFSRVFAALQTLEYDVAYQQLLTKSGSLPDTYLVYFLVSDVPDQFADDAETRRAQRVQVSYYSRNGIDILPDIDGAMAAIGGLKGTVRPLAWDPDTRHFGLAIEYVFSDQTEPEGS